jgi:glycosyltransferase involved in cell wall biosynthesis
MDKVSIIIPVYKAAEFLPRCIDSCINQTYHNIEIIIVIDGSPDNSYEIAKSYREKYNRLLVINKANEGLPKTRRIGFENSTGDYIFHLDSDDYIEPVTIDLLLKTLHNENADVVVGGTRYENRTGIYITSWLSKVSGSSKTDYLNDLFSLKLQSNIWGRLIKRKIFEPVFVPSQYNCGEDVLANVMMICYAPNIKISVEPTLLYHYVVYNESLTNTWPAEAFMPFTEEIAKILIESGLEENVMKSWAYSRVVNSWRYYLRRGGKTYLRDKKFVHDFYCKYFQIVKDRLTFIERFELILYKYNQPIAWNFSRIYLKFLKIAKQFSN